MQIPKRYYSWGGLALLLGVAVILSSDTYARASVANETPGGAFSTSIHYLLVQPIGTIFLLLPYLVVGIVASFFAKVEHNLKSWCLFICGVAPLMALYFQGYMSAQQAILEKKWTAASLAVGFLPFVSVPAIGVGLVVGWAISTLFGKLGLK
ncbi:MAG: hypothetical protein LC754_19385 [Acidobacteria bacterium]|nr:hypothetical protein [Acidobacteriota bacterium]